ncbi:hypothetical protein DL237_06035 [Pseudooceanicola sediminis]|uniref:RHS repeat protein n=1 Tax=Pseudooceanicola sediminis TaxID=2211117 RepID=A0A399J355_9RHOB|nr:hypothetical protein [Pseudooceanicola sediminis]KAA2317347.1 hypothetical protein E0K93_03410 [Puniceibacterium sp. HSS470]RII39700.1 hypothetical protein DL237_06035 [Pseudooceanicola sediminis]|tara:strand:+ start:30361 stop:30666 length:306 start_codon:yes stop_codon:yes gene_type:complete
MTTFTKILSGAAVVALLPLSAFANTNAQDDATYSRSNRLSAPITRNADSTTVATQYTYDNRGEIVPAKPGDQPLTVTKGNSVATNLTYDRRGEFVPAHPNQ